MYRALVDVGVDDQRIQSYHTPLSSLVASFSSEAVSDRGLMASIVGASVGRVRKRCRQFQDYLSELSDHLVS